MEMKSNMIMPIAMGVSSYYIASNIMLTRKNGVYNHVNKLYMALLMVDIMFLIDGVMKKNVVSIGLSLTAGAILTSLIREQSFVSDKQFAKGMIEHHDMALLMAKKIKEKTKNEEVIKLADNILKTQQSEIDLMKSWLK